jgi:predicted transcriptional regulator
MQEELILRILEESKLGKTITEIVKETNLSRSSIRTALARLEGAKTVNIRKIGMAKVYSLNQNADNAQRECQAKNQICQASHLGFLILSCMIPAASAIIIKSIIRLLIAGYGGF